MDEIKGYLGFPPKESLGDGGDKGNKIGCKLTIADSGGLEVHYIILYTDMSNILPKRKKRRIPYSVLIQNRGNCHIL